MKSRRFLLPTLAALAFAIAPGLCASHALAQPAPSIETNTTDYLPGETVIIMGSGFQPGETVDISIAIDDDLNNVHIGDYDWMVELANDSGNFTTFWTVPLEAYGMTLRATAMGLTSGSIATTIFYDSHGTHNVNFRVVGMESLPSPDGFFINVTRAAPATHTVGSQTVLVWTDGQTSSDVGAAALTGNITYSGFPSSYTTPNGTYTLVNTLPGSGFPSGLSSETTTVVATYSFAPRCSVSNTAPTLSASGFNLGDSCPPGGVLTVTVTPQDFTPATTDFESDPVSITFADGTTSKTLTFDALTSSYTFAIRATDDPSARNIPSCPPLPALSVEVFVTVSANITAHETNDAPVISASDLNLGDVCTGSNLVVPVSLASFNASAFDPDADPFTLDLQGVTQVTLALPPGFNDGLVSVPVVINATDDPSLRSDPDCGALAPMSSSTIVYVTATLHRNTPPSIAATDANLGSLVGCLSAGTFSRNVAVSPALFGASALDAEGDPVSLVASVSNVTLVGPGLASANVVLTATDNPSARTGGACSPASSSTTVRVTARITYRFDGVYSPLSNCHATKVRRGSTVPVKFRLYDCSNTQITSVLLNPAGGPDAHTIDVTFNQCNAPDGAVDVDDAGNSNDNGINFRYSGGNWIYNLKTNSSYNLHTTYRIRIRLNDGTVHSAMISIK